MAAVFSLFLVIALFSPAIAQENSVSSILKAYRVVKGDNGAESFLSADKASPGDLIEYRLTMTNGTGKKIKNLLATLPIPAGTLYLRGSAAPGEEMASTDGKKFEKMPLVRKMKQVDGSIKTVEVPYSSYRFLRWKTSEMESGKGTVFKARVKILGSQASSSVKTSGSK